MKKNDDNKTPRRVTMEELSDFAISNGLLTEKEANVCKLLGYIPWVIQLRIKDRADEKLQQREF